MKAGTGETEKYVDDPSKDTIIWDIDNLASGETITKQVEIRIDNIDVAQAQIENVVNAKMILEGEEETTISTTSLTQTVKKSGLNIEMDAITRTNSILRETDTIQYNIKITNMTDQDIDNVEMQNYLPENTIYDTCYLFDSEAERGIGTQATYNENLGLIDLQIGLVEANTTKSIILKISVAELENSQTSAIIENKVLVTSSSESISNYESNTITHQVKIGLLEITQTSEHPDILNPGDNVKYIINVTNIGEATQIESMQDIVPSEIKVLKYTCYKDTDPDDKIEVETFNSNILIFNTINVGETVIIEIEGQVKDLPEGVDQTEITNTATTEKGRSASVTNTIQKEEQEVLIDVTSVELNKSTLSLEEGEDETLVALVLPVNATNKNVTWTSSNLDVATVESNGKVTAVAEGTTIISVTTEDGGKIAECIVNITKQEVIPDPDPDPDPINVTSIELNKSTLSLKVGEDETLVANILPTDATNKNVTWTSSNSNVATVNSNGKVTAVAEGTALITAFTEDQGLTDTCSVTITEDSEEPTPTPTKYKIEGKAWFDENKNGKKDSNEVLLGNIKVSLVNVATQDFVKNPDNSRKFVTTGLNGYYVFNDLDAGEYIVVFEYDTKQYTVASYQKEQVPTDINSDVYNRYALIEGTLKLVAITDNIKITNSDFQNIDIGLIENAKFDLSLNKEVSKITINNDSGSTTYNYPENTKLAKVEIKGKDISKSVAIIEYSISITNEGEVAAYVPSIVDYIPKTLTFNSEINPKWYTGTNGNLYNTELMNSPILPGQTKTVKLSLTKALSEDSVGLITNTSEISINLNLEGIPEYDSIAGNQNSSEDDFSKADVLIAIKTGGIELYVFITILSMLIISGGIYMINKRVLNPEYIKGGK